MHILQFIIPIVLLPCFDNLVLALQQRTGVPGLTVTNHVLELEAKPLSHFLTPSSGHLAKRQELFEEEEVDESSVEDFAESEEEAQSAIGVVQQDVLTLGGRVYMTNVSLASQSYTLVIDTGSSDTWVASTRFRCLSPSTRRRLPQSSCGFGKLFNISDSPTFETIPTHDFSVQYTDGEYLLGEMGTEELEVGGWRTRQTIGVVERGWWIGDGLSSGLMGLAYPTLASGVNDLNYTSIAFTLFEDGTVPSIFSLALSRPSVDNPVAGGLLAIGGIPDIPLDGDFVSVPIQPIISDQYAFYSVPVDGIAVTPPEGWIPPTRRRQRKTRPFHRPLHRQTTNNQTHIFHLTSSRAHQNPQADPGSSSEDSGLEMIIDSGTTLIYVPWDIAAAIGSFFVPPAIFNETSNLWIVHCDAALPDIGVIIGGKLLKIDPRDLIGPGGGTMVTKNHDGVAGGVTKTQMCVPSIQGRVSGDSVLGDAFLKSVVAVFDVGVNEMRFAQRAPY